MIVPRFPWSDGLSNMTTTESSSTGILERSSGGISMRAISSDGFSCFLDRWRESNRPRWKLEVSTSRRAVQHLPREARQFDVARVVQGVDFPSLTQRLPDGRNALDEELAVLLAFRAAAAEGLGVLKRVVVLGAELDDVWGHTAVKYSTERQRSCRCLSTQST